MDIKKNKENTIPTILISLIKISTISFIKKVMMNKFTPQRFKCHTPIKEIKLDATSNPNNAGYQSPNFFIAGANTPGKLNTIQIKPNTQTMVSKTGRFFNIPSIFKKLI